MNTFVVNLLKDISKTMESSDSNLDSKLSELSEILERINSAEVLNQYINSDFKKLNITGQERTRAKYLIEKKIQKNS